MQWFGLVADDVVTAPWQQHHPLTAAAALFPFLREIIKKRLPHYVIVQGDTTTAYAAALAGADQDIPVVHVEAGLRSGNMKEPWPEEYFRTRISKIADLHFAPTGIDRDNLLTEGVSQESIFVTGNTVIDALQLTLDRLKNEPGEIALAEPFILLTMHRRENLERRKTEITRLIERISEITDLPILFPVHENPEVQAWAHTLKSRVPGLCLLAAQDYPDFIRLVMHCRLILSDSGGIQEEAGYLKRPMILLREFTERPTAMAHGAVLCMSTDPEIVLEAIHGVLSSPETRSIDPLVFGNGKAAEIILQELKRISAKERTE